MSDRSVTHSTFVIERRYPAKVERVFAGFSDVAKKRRWYAEGEEHKVERFEMEFRVGGRELAIFRGNGMVFANETIYRDILPKQRIVFSYTMSMGDRVFSSSQTTIEFLSKGDETQLIFTEQGAYFEGADGPQMREMGWRKLLDNLGKHLAN